MFIKTSQSFEIYHDLVINESLTKVFEAIIEPNHLINWWPLKCTGIPKLGESYNFHFSLKYDWFGSVVKFSHNSAFHIKMTQSDTNWNPTTFGFDIEEVNGSVILKFKHIGWPKCNAEYRQSSYCWAMLLNGLKNYVEKNVIIPFEERE